MFCGRDWLEYACFWLEYACFIFPGNGTLKSFLGWDEDLPFSRVWNISATEALEISFALSQCPMFGNMGELTCSTTTTTKPVDSVLSHLRVSIAS